MESLLLMITIILQFGTIISDSCSKYSSVYGVYYTYCSGYCTGGYGYEYCSYYYYNDYNASLSVGSLVGISIGSIIFFVIVIGVIVAVCSSCTRSAGTRGRVVHVHPVNTTGVTVVQQVVGNQNYSIPYTYMPPGGYYGTNPQPLSSNMQQPLSANMQQPLSANMQQPPSSNIQQPPSSNMQKPPSSNMQQPPSSTMQQPLSSHMEDPPPDYSILEQPASGSTAPSTTYHSNNKSK